MSIHIKNSFFILLVLIGFYFFHLEYKKLSLLKFNIEKKYLPETQKDDQNKINKYRDVQQKEQSYQIDDEEILDKIEILISKGDTLLSILKRFRLADKNVFEIIKKIEKFYDLKKLKVNDKLFIHKNIEGEVKKIELDLDFNHLLIVSINEDIIVEKKELKINSYQISNEFKVNQSIYSDGLKNNLPQDILIKLIKLFSFDLDFQRDIKKNTLVSVSYSYDQILENNKVEFKDINYALISINGKSLEYFKFITNDGYIDYFNREGKNVKKSLLKTPLDGARLSSNFGMRKHPISGYNKMHKGVDFAAPKGTPIYAGGNGVIEFLGNNGGYGKYIRIRHNNNYKTAYAHLSGYKKGISKGARVNQGDIIGFVGSTGNSTGPHLHYEIIYQGNQINPLKLKLPSGKVLKGEELKRFVQEYKEIYANHLNLLYE